MCRFLLVSLNIESILGEVTIRQRRKKLEEMIQGGGLSDAYTATLSRLKAQKGYKSVLGLKVLMWVLYSKQPLKADELCHALGVEIGSLDLDPENVPALRTLVASCLGLVTVEASSSTVRLVHFTLQEHLASDPTLFQNPHSTIAEVCLTYLNFGSVRDLSLTLRDAPPTMPFLEYASVYWGNHTRMGMTENVKLLALRLLDRFDQHIAAHLLLLSHCSSRFKVPYYNGEAGPKGFTGLHGVAFLGIVEIAEAVLGMKEWGGNATDCMGSTALIWATMRGHDGVVKVLLEKEDVNPDQADTQYGRTPLWWAARKGYEGVVKMLLEREDVNPNQTTIYGRAPLWWAAKKGHEGVVKMLLEREDVNLNQADTQYGRTPLWQAVINGHEGIVKMLLEREDVNLNQADTQYGRTPLWWAAEKGYEGVVKMLLEREDINPNQADTQYCRTPLSRAARKGHEGVVKILLEREDINPNQVDTEYGATPLSWAAGKGHGGVVKMLLEREDVSPDQPDTQYGATSFSWAAKSGHEGVVKLILEREDVNPNRVDAQYGAAPLSWAAENGHKEVVKMLLEQEEMNPDLADTEYGRTPLSRAARKGHEGVVKILLEREDVSPDRVDTKYGLTPLSWAADSGHDGIVEMLLGRKDVNPNQSDTTYGRTPLSWAAYNGHQRVVKMLLEREDVCTATPDKENQTPLSLALSQGHDEVVIILESNNANSDTLGYCAQTPLPQSTVYGDECVIRTQIPGNDSSADTTDFHGSPAPLSADLDTQEVVLDSKDFTSMCADSGPSTEPSNQSQPPSVKPLEPPYPLRKTVTHPTATQLILTFFLDRRFITSALICLLAFLLYILPPSSPDLFSFRKYLPSD